MKKTLTLLVFIMFALVLVACGGSKGNSEYNVVSIDELKEYAESQEDGKVKISFLVREGVVSKALVSLEAAFEEAYPYIDAEIKTISGSYDDLRSTTILDINSDSKENIPDLIMGYPDHFAEYYGGGNLVNLQKFIEDKEVGYSEEELADFLPAYLNESRGFNTERPDDLYGFPFNKSTEVLVYNKTAMEILFGDNYLDKIPETWEEVRTVSQEIIDKVKAGALDNYWVTKVDTATNTKEYLKVSDYLKNGAKNFYPFAYDSSDNAFITLTRQFGGQYTERVDIETGYILFDNAQTRSALAYFQQMKKDQLFAVPAIFGKDYASDCIKLIQIIMSVGSTAGVGYNASTLYEYEVAAAPIPYQDANNKYVIQQGTNIGMLGHNNDYEKLAAWLFMKFLLEPDNTAQFAMDTGGYLPVRTSAYQTTKYQEYLTNPSDDKAAYSMAANVALYDYIEKGYKFFVDPAFIGSSSVRNEVGDVFDAIIVNEKDIKTRLEEAYRSLLPYNKPE